MEQRNFNTFFIRITPEKGTPPAHFWVSGDPL
jgi:hypothetical protein